MRYVVPPTGMVEGLAVNEVMLGPMGTDVTLRTLFVVEEFSEESMTAAVMVYVPAWVGVHNTE